MRIAPMTKHLTLMMLLILPSVAQGDVWTDPRLGDAVRAADYIVRVKAPEDGSKGVPQVSFAVDAVLKGKLKEGATLDVGGLHDATRVSGATFQPGESLILILQHTKKGLQVPTPTFGRFPIRDGVVRFASLRDTYLRFDVPVGDFQTFIALHLGRKNDAWLKALRADLAAGDPGTAKDAALMRLYLALESLAVVGVVSDRELIGRYLVSEGPFQLRVSACRAAAHAAGAASAGRLLHVAKTDEEPAVRTAAVRLLGRLKPRPSKLVQKLAALLPLAPTKEVRFSGPNDPRLNKWPSPKGAILRSIRRLGAAPVKTAILEVVADPAPPDVFTAALQALMSLKADPALPAELVLCFRAKREASSALYNAEICAALTKITGKKLGNDVDAWRRAVKN
jgi:hypothetical protein